MKWGCEGGLPGWSSCRWQLLIKASQAVESRGASYAVWCPPPR